MSTEQKAWNPLTEWKHTDIDWVKVNISREDLGRFTKRSDLKGLAQAFGFLLVIAATATVAYIAFARQMWVLLGVALYFHGGFYSYFGPALHELSHGTVFRSRWLSDAMTVLFSVLYWPMNPFLYRMSHQGYHHKYTLHQGSDGEDVPMYMELTPRFIFSLFFSVLHIKDLAFNLYRLFTLTPTSNGWRGRGFKLDLWEQFIIKNAPERDLRRMRSIVIINLIVQPLIVVVCVLTGLWFIPLLVTLAPFYGPRFLSFMVGIHQHAACDANDPDFRKSCGDTVLNPFLSLMYWHMEHHIEHHMFAAIPCYNLKAFSRFVADQLPPKTRVLPRLLFLHKTCKQKYGSYDVWRKEHGLYKGL